MDDAAMLIKVSGPTAAARLEVGSETIVVNGQPVESKAQVKEAVAANSSSDTIQVTLLLPQEEAKVQGRHGR